MARRDLTRFLSVVTSRDTRSALSRHFTSYLARLATSHVSPISRSGER